MEAAVNLIPVSNCELSAATFSDNRAQLNGGCSGNYCFTIWVPCIHVCSEAQFCSCGSQGWDPWQAVLSVNDRCKPSSLSRVTSS